MELYEQVGSLLEKKRSAACFFLPDDRGEPSLQDLATRTGVKQYWEDTSLPAGGQWLVRAWGGIEPVVLCLERRPRHYLFEIQFSMYDLWDLERDEKDTRELPLEEEPYYPLVLAFRDACRALDPVMAIITWLPQQDHRYVREVIEDALRGFYPDQLVSEFGLIYLSDPLFWWWYASPEPDLPHDLLPTERGALVFSSQGRHRWTWDASGK